MDNMTRKLNVGTQKHVYGKLELEVEQKPEINNVVQKIHGYASIEKEALDHIYISDYRVYVKMQSGLEFSIPVKGSEL